LISAPGLPAAEVPAARERVKVRLETKYPISDIRILRSELHRQLDKAIDNLQKHHPNGEPYVI
jgi:hypothetical protein